MAVGINIVGQRKITMSSNDPNTKEWRLAQAEKEEERHANIKLRLDELKKPHWTVLPNFWLTLIAALAAVAAAFIAWRE